MRNLIRLIDAVCDTYDRRDLQPLPDGTTFCNVSVAAITEAMGCKDLALKTADEIVAFVSDSPDWSIVAFEKAQDMANQGTLLIAGLDSPSLKQAHGHVVVIRPGIACWSGKWGPTPRCLNVGAEMFLSRAKKGPLTAMACGLNEAFVEMPKIWAWRPSL